MRYSGTIFTQNMKKTGLFTGELKQFSRVLITNEGKGDESKWMARTAAGLFLGADRNGLRPTLEGVGAEFHCQWARLVWEHKQRCCDAGVKEPYLER
jgi:hypothetical protein